MSRSFPFRITRRLLAAGVVALACTACGKSAEAPAPASPTSTPAASSASSSSTETGSGTTTTSTTPALPGTGRPSITVGDKNYPEQFVLGQLYVQALTAQGFSATLNQNIGPTAVTVQALRAGSLSMYPEYLNVFDSTVAGYRHGFRSQLAAYQAAQHYALDHGLQLLAPTPFSDTDALAVTDAYAAQNHLHTIGDLRRVARQLTIGGAPQFQQAIPGLPAISRVYGVTPASFKPMAVGDQYAGLNTASVQAAYVNTTDAQLATGDYQVLGDPRQIFGWGNVVPVVAGKVLAEEGPAFVDVIQRVDDALKIDAIRQMNEAVEVAQQDPAAVAKQFLETHGLLTPGVY
jgi:osmoprotectant transport system substrate-binding protein